MWNRVDLKNKSKSILKMNYWKAFVVSLVMGIVSGGCFSSSYYCDGNVSHIAMDMAAICGTLAFIGVLVRIFVGYMLEVGGRKFFVKSNEGEVNMGHLGFVFSSGKYVNVLAAMLLRDIFTFLWSLLFIIPGIIKCYSYRMVPYILADNPNIDCMRAIDLSKQMTKGEKWDMFVMDLSFIGWYLLGLIACGVGVLFVHPYYDTTFGGLYVCLRDKALASGLTTREELALEE